MIRTKITREYTLEIPESFRKNLRAGQEVALAMDIQGRMIVTPIEQIRAQLSETFGMWNGRDGIPPDGIAFMDDVRKGRRLKASGG
jgi:hypothetical protein